MVWNVVENYVVTFRTFREILFRIIDDVICAERSNQIDIPCAAYAGHICTERFRDLHGERADASGRTVNQDLLPGLNFSFVAEGLQCRDSSYIDRSRFLKRQVRRFERNCSVCARTYVLGEGPGFPAEHFITWFELRDVFADGFNCSCKVNTQPRVLWFSQSNPHHAHDLGRAFNEMPVEWIHRSCANSNQELIVRRSRLFDVLKLEIGHTIVAVNNSFHRIVGTSGVEPTVIGRCPVSDFKPRQQGEQDYSYTPL